jgi:ATP-binding cassette, subfamily B, multidrug efflux pump
MRKLLRFVRPHLVWFIAALVFTLTGVASALIPPSLAGRIVDGVFVASVNDGDFSSRLPLLGALILGIVLATGGRSLSIYLRNTVLETASQRALRDLKQTMYDHIQGLSFDFFHRTRTGELMARMTNDIEMVRGALVMGIMHGATGVFYVVSSGVILFSLNWQLALISVVASPFLFLATYRLRTSIFPKFQDVRTQYSALNTAVQENISGIRVVKSLMRYDYELEKFRKQNHGLTETRDAALHVWAKYMPAIEFLSGVAGVLVLLVGGRMVINGGITLGRWVEFNSYLWMLVTPMRMLGDVVNQIALAQSSSERIFEILETEPNITSPPNPVRPEKISGEVEFRGVSWRVEGKPILANIDLHAKPGSTIAIMGPTGSGKSSLVHLIPRFYDPDQGQVLIDGVDVREYDLGFLREQIGLVAQETFLFSETMYNNLTYGRRRPLEFVQRVAAQTQSHFFIRTMSDGYDTVVGERGVGLSGGQKQRASIARALLKEAPILILDDSTSSVDMETEALIQKALRNLERNVTTFIIAHRISSVKHADEIILLDHGGVAERGTHDELIAADGLYADYFRVQYADSSRLDGRRS